MSSRAIYHSPQSQSFPGPSSPEILGLYAGQPASLPSEKVSTKLHGSLQPREQRPGLVRLGCEVSCGGWAGLHLTLFLFPLWVAGLSKPSPTTAASYSFCLGSLDGHRVSGHFTFCWDSLYLVTGSRRAMSNLFYFAQGHVLLTLHKPHLISCRYLSPPAPSSLLLPPLQACWHSLISSPGISS